MVRRRPYVPERGDLIWLAVDPQAGHEQAGQRPALVLSPASYNGKTSLALVCPVTAARKGYPFEVDLPPGLGVHGVILADQLRCLDWRARHAAPAATAPPQVLEEVLARVRALLGL
ncbi:MAG: endoribonuclease MazF [Candidatus Tectomicrobia bacterium]|nr:endoribonuclease MazF [Candidatus Tectomicrobia bacterium]